MNKYLFLRRYARGPIDIVRVHEERKGQYVILEVLLNTDPKMSYEKKEDPDGTIYFWSVDNELDSYIMFPSIKDLNQYDEVHEFEDNDAALLFYECMER